MNLRHVLALCAVAVGVALEALAMVGSTNSMLRGAGALLLIFGLVIEIIGIAIYDES
jgi:hypothetical protein